MKRFLSITSVAAVVLSLTLLCLTPAHAKKPPQPPGGGGGGGGSSDLVTPAYVIMDGDNLSRLKLLSFDGLSEQEIVKAKAFRGMKAPTWSPDGQWIAFTRGEDLGKSLRIIRPDGSGEQVIYHFTGQVGEPPVIDSLHGMQWIPGEVDRIVYLSYNGEICVISTLGQNPEPVIILPEWYWLAGVTLSPDMDSETPGYQGAVAFVEDRLLNVAFAEDDGFSLQIDTTSLVAATSLNDGVATPAWSHDGLEIAFLYHNYTYPDFGNSLEVLPVLVDAGGIALFEGSVRTLYDSSLVDSYGPYHAVYHRPSWSPDDSMISCCAQVGGEADGSKAFDLFLAATDGSGAVNVTNGSMRPINVDWNPNWDASQE